jgi:broad specificity phosphatase PhoE
MTIKAQKWPNNLILVRHGESARNVAKDQMHKVREAIYWAPDMGRDQDTPLTQKGREQAIKMVDYVLSRFAPPEIIIVSPFLRAVETADAFREESSTHPKFVIEERVREIEFGILDGLTAKGIRDKYPEEWARKQREGKYWYRPPGGENRPDVRDRVRDFLGTLTREYVGKTVVVVCHSVIVQVFRSLLERWDETEYIRADKEEDVKNCSVTAYVYNVQEGKLHLQLCNMTPWEADS